MAQEPNTLSPDEKAGGWQLLFDGRTADRWVGFKKDALPEGWQVEDGCLVRKEKAGDIVTRDAFADFELAIEWKISEGGNSGILFRVTDSHDAVWQTGHEMQVLDNDRHRDGQNPLTMVNSCYALYPPKDEKDWCNPVGEWNQVRIVADGPHVEFWCNGTKVVGFRIGSDEWTKRVADSKFAKFAGFGTKPEGRIALQDHGDWVAYRNIKVRPL
jgi:hypothetical protein